MHSHVHRDECLDGHFNLCRDEYHDVQLEPFCGCFLVHMQALVFLKGLVDDGRGSGSRALDFVMHADDDSFVRLDLLAPLLVSTREGCWG